MNRNFRLDAKHLFLTYPQCNLDKTVALNSLLAKPLLANPVAYCIAQEHHQDGSLHLHCLLTLPKRVHITRADYLDINGFHGNYQAARVLKQVHKYVIKDDPDPLNTFEDEILNPPKKSTRVEIGNRILKGEELNDLVEEYPNLLFGYNKLKDDIKAFTESKMEFKPLPLFFPNPWGFLMPAKNTCKKRHWWLWSSQPNRGKTTWARTLEKDYGAHIKSGDFTYWRLHGKEQVLILDDYNFAGVRYHCLNQICDGTFEFRCFMAGLRRLEGLRLVIVLSNQPIASIYPNMYALLEARFIEKELV